jgi:hypothetical protein
MVYDNYVLVINQLNKAAPMRRWTLTALR